MSNEVLINISNRHLHLSEDHVEILFGESHKLTNIKDLIQPGQFACDETVEIIGPKGAIAGVRVIGPTRKQTQIEILIADAYKLGVPSVIRDSADLKDTPGIKVKGPCGEIEIEEGVIVAARHLHLHSDEAAELGYKDKDIIKVKVDGARGIVFENVLVRVSDSYKLEMHIDVEEANAALVKNGQLGQIIE